MNVAQVTAEILKREGVEILIVYPLNPLTESAAAVDIRPIVVRQERVGAAMADAMSRLTSGDKVGVFACQNGPGIENAFGAVAQAYSENVPLVVIPGGMPRGVHNVRPTFNAALNFQHITKSAETVTTPDMLVPALRRAFSMARNGRPGPCLRRDPRRHVDGGGSGRAQYTGPKRMLIAPDPNAIDAAAEALLEGESAADLRRAGRALREGLG